jgi:hypothetical protein
MQLYKRDVLFEAVLFFTVRFVCILYLPGKRQQSQETNSTAPAGFELTTPKSEQPQSEELDRAATRIICKCPLRGMNTAGTKLLAS